MDAIGKIHSFQSLGTVDGPGVRGVVFLQGCNLRCGYCHNPDTWDGTVGQEMTAAAVFEKLRRYRNYYGKTGGVTVSGGEALLQPDFVFALFSICKGEGLHTCLDTSGSLWSEKIEQLLTVTDLVLLDVKMTTEEAYQKYIGGSIKPVLRFLDELEKRKIATWIRQVIVPGINDNRNNLQELAELLKGKTCVEKVELLPFKKLCGAKYENLGIPFAFDRYPQASPQKVAQLQEYLDEILVRK